MINSSEGDVVVELCNWKTRDTMKTAFLLLRWMVTTDRVNSRSIDERKLGCNLFISHSSLMMWSSTWTWTQLAALLLAPLSFLLFLAIVPAPSQLPTPKLHHILQMSMLHKAPYYSYIPITFHQYITRSQHTRTCMSSKQGLLFSIVLNSPFTSCYTKWVFVLPIQVEQTLRWMWCSPPCFHVAAQLQLCQNSLAFQESAKYTLKLYQPHAW